MSTVNIAIDGPAGAGKSTIAKGVAAKLSYIYVDTGALYRTIGVRAHELNVGDRNEAELSEMLKSTDIEIKYDNSVQKVYCNGEDFSQKIRTPEASMAASAVSSVPCVRAFLLELQRDIARKNNCIMDGRDIGTVVLPDAQIKIFLTADVRERARRRHTELLEKGINDSFETVLEDMEKRDYQDSHREIAPLKPAEDSIVFDTTGLTLDESVSKMMNLIQDVLTAKVCE